MKKLFLIIHFSLFVLHSFAQREYWGMTTVGGKYFDTATGNYGGAGVIFKTNKYGKHYQVAYNFDSATGIEPHGSLIKATNGKLYGITGKLSSTMFTCLFEFDPIKRVYKVLMRADTFRNGRSYSFGSPFQASNGKLYSLVSSFLIETDLNTGVNTVIASGLNPAAGENYFMQASNGKVYFVTINTNLLVGQHGALYELDLASKTVVLRHQFLDQTGSKSFGSPVEWSPGLLYGTFRSGENSTTEYGGIWSYNLNTGLYTMKQTFYNAGITTGSTALAYGGLTRFGNKLYGATQYNGAGNYGFLYSYDPVINKIDTLTNFAKYFSIYPTYDSLRDDYYGPSYGWGTELLASYDNKLYGLTTTSMFSYNPVDSSFKNINSLRPALTDMSGKLGYHPTYAHLLETCTPPYYLNTISDTLYFLMGQPATFTISTPNTDTFHWTKNNTAIALADSTLSFTSIALADSGTYQCLLKNECGDSLLKSFYVKVGQILPIGFALTGKVQNNNAVLQWQDLAANNVNYYELQRSADGRNFAPLTKVSATNQTAYRFTDVNAFASPSPSERDGVRLFYRLKQTGKDGKENLSNIVELYTEPSTLNFALSPNPTKDKLTVTLANYEGKATLTIVDVKGAVLLTKTVGNGNNTIHLRNWSAGEYVVVITDKTGRSESKKVVVVE